MLSVSVPGQADHAIQDFCLCAPVRRHAQSLRDRMRSAKVRDIEQARQRDLINDVEAAQLRAADQAVAAAIAVDDFSPHELSAHRAMGDVPSQSVPRPAAAE